MVRLIALALTVLTGFSGLVYEVTWQKYFGTLLGSDSEATAAVLALFLGGLSAGYSLFGRITRRVVARAQAGGRRPRLLLLYGAVEGAIGLYALAFPTLFDAVRALSFSLHVGAAGAGFAIDAALSALLIGPPTVLMGGTIPVLTQGLARTLQDATRVHAWVYAFNTAGAFTGALAAGFVLVPTLGLESCMRAMGLVNVAAGAVFALVGLVTRGASRELVVAAPASGPVAAPAGFALYSQVALLSGFAMMVIQTVLNRLGALAFGSSQYTFSMIVAVFVLSIAIGSFLVSALPRIPGGAIVATQWLLVALLTLLYRPLENAGWWVYRLRQGFGADDAEFMPYWLAAFGWLLAALAVPISLSGAILPLLFHHLRREVADLGAVAGRLYSWNTLGSLLGALLGGYALLFVLDLHHVYRLALAALGLSATLLTLRVLRTPPLATLALGLAPVLLALALLPPWRAERLSSGLFRVASDLRETGDDADTFYARTRKDLKLLFHDDDPVSTVAVGQTRMVEFGLTTTINNNGKSDGAIPADNPTMVLVGMLPALFAEKLERAFVIGYGTGMTAGELAALPGMQQVDVAEISPAVIAAAPHFDFANQAASKSPKVRVLRGDAFRILVRGDTQYDVIASEPSNPWVTGVENLFSVEFLSTARRRLAPGGVWAQWFHVYETDTETVALVLRTYARVFEHVAVWYGLGPDLVVLGFDDDRHALDLDRLERRASTPAMRAALLRGRVPSFVALLGHELLPIGVVRPEGLPGPVHTLAKPILSHRAARAFFRRGSAELPGTFTPAAARIGADHSLLRRYAAREGGQLTEDEREQVARELCSGRFFECETFLAEWTRLVPSSPARAAALERLARASQARADSAVQAMPVLGRLFAPDGATDEVAVEHARRLTELFAKYYFHAAPFSRDALASVWARCSDPTSDGERCRRNLELAEQWIGGLVPSAPASTSAAAAP
jgi:predicted membrane-bound spermidine synthase